MLNAGPLRIGRILADAHASHSSSGGLQRSSSLQLFDVTVNGVTYGFNDKGFSTGSSTSPLPADPAVEQLAKAGISVTYLGAKEVPDGVLSPGLRIQIDNEQTDMHTVLVVGQALAVASGDAASAAPGLLGGGLFNGGFPGVSAGTPSHAGSASGASTASTEPSGGGLSTSGSAAPIPPPAPPSEGTQSGQAPATGTPLSSRPVSAGTAPGTSFYLLLVAGAVVAVVASQLISVVGVRWAR
jgi:hypothetical protein